jgi:hypothetical protein
MGCGDFVDVFSEDPQNMPGQGLARPDNYRSAQATKDYDALIGTQLGSEENLGARFAGARLKSLGTTLGGAGDTPGIAEMYLQALREADPEAAALMDSLMASASQELALDNQLDPNQTRLVEQAGRASAAARGMGFGPSDAFAETLAKLGVGEQMRDKRRSNALTLAQLRTALAARPVDMATSTATSAPAASAQMFDTLNRVYAENQANNRAQSELETKVGMDQANKWNSWGSFAAGAI